MKTYTFESLKQSSNKTAYEYESYVKESKKASKSFRNVRKAKRNLWSLSSLSGDV